MKIPLSLLAALMVMLTAGCSKPDDDSEHQATPYQIVIPFGFPTHLNIPADNPMTVEGVRLGRSLFYDGRIAGSDDPDSMMSCATCHLQERAFECGIDHPKYTGGRPFGLTGIPTPHVMLPLFNTVWNASGYLWNGKISQDNPDHRYQDLEDLTWMSIVAPHEMNSDTARAVNMIQSIAGYGPLFEAAFGSDKVTIDRMAKAISQFIRSITSTNSRFDQYLRGEVQLNPSELNGFVLFSTEEGADCFHCHGGSGNPLFTTNLFYNNGKDSVFNDPADRYAITGDPMHRGAYRAPTLRNIELTGPYMHDGRFSTLDEVIDFYSEGLIYTPLADPLMHWITNGGVRLTDNEKADLKAFLLTLTDQTLMTDSVYSKPMLPE